MAFYFNFFYNVVTWSLIVALVMVGAGLELCEKTCNGGQETRSFRLL